MRRPLLLLFALLALELVTLAPTPDAHANPRYAFAFGWTYSPHRDHLVEQELNPACPNTTESHNDPACQVWNNTASGSDPGCAWDVDDNSGAAAGGTLAAGESASWTQCQIVGAFNGPADVAHCETSCGRPYGVWVSSSSPLLQVRSCFAPSERCFDAGPVWNAREHRYEYSLCLREVYPYQDPLVQTIPDSNGGSGVRVTQTTSVSNPTGKTVLKTSAYINQIGWYQAANGCAYAAGDANRDDPYRWTSS